MPAVSAEFRIITQVVAAADEAIAAAAQQLQQQPRTPTGINNMERDSDEPR